MSDTITTTIILTGTQRAMLHAVLGLSPGAPQSILRGVAWAIEHAYLAVVPPEVRSRLKLNLEHEPRTL